MSGNSTNFLKQHIYCCTKFGLHVYYLQQIEYNFLYIRYHLFVCFGIYLTRHSMRGLDCPSDYSALQNILYRLMVYWRVIGARNQINEERVVPRIETLATYCAF